MQDVNDVAAAVLGELGPMDAMKLQKLVYYSQAWNLAINDEPLFPEPIQAWAQGPVVNALYQQHRRRRTVSSWPSGNASRIDRDVLALVGLVCRKYGDLSGDELSTLTHSEAPWLAARGALPEGASSRAHLSETVMASYYRNHQLGGRLAADLAVGGIHPAPAASATAWSAADHKARVAALRAEYASRTNDHPAPGEDYGRGKNTPLTKAELEGMQRTRSRVRPERRRASV